MIYADTLPCNPPVVRHLPSRFGDHVAPAPVRKKNDHTLAG
jgi:hypothetical protein